MKNNCAREKALKIFTSIMRDKAYSNIALKKQLDLTELNKLDKALVTEIVYGTLKNLIFIDWILDQFIKSNKNKIKPVIEDLLRCGTYQIMFLDRVPDSAVCNESSELGRKYGHEGIVKFVNGILRNISRNKDKIKYPDKDAERSKYLSVTYSYPIWIIDKWTSEYGESFCEELLMAGNETADLCVRINYIKIKKEKLMDILEKEDISVEGGRYVEEAIYLKGISALEERKSFASGYYQVQDESSMLVAHILNPKPDDLIIDVCSAPGGKSTHIAEIMENQGSVISRDIHPHKMQLIERNAKRLGINIIKSEVYDALKLDKTLVGKADKVLVDAPCSGLGIVRRKPDLKYNNSPGTLEDLEKMQLEILKVSSEYVKKGGVLVYSTCTINNNENIHVVEKFLDLNKEFFLEDIEDFIPPTLHGETSKLGYIQLFPNVHKIDGFFIARLKRR